MMLSSNEHITPAWLRARITAIRKLIEELPTNRDDKNPDRTLIRNGFIPESQQKRFSEHLDYEYKLTFALNEPLTFTEITSFNTWFVMHPEKICGKEIVTTSREFPISVKGTKDDISHTIKEGLKVSDQNNVHPEQNSNSTQAEFQQDTQHIEPEPAKPTNRFGSAKKVLGWEVNEFHSYYHDAVNEFEKIKPNDSLVYHSIISKQNSKYRNFDSIRFGLILLDTIKCKTYIDFIDVLGDRSKQDNIIWSNPLTFLQDYSQKFFVNNIRWSKENKDYCFPLLFVSSLPDTINTFVYKSLIKDYQESDSCIKISIKYGGGCNNANIQIMADTTNASNGSEIKLYFAFQDYDNCKALLRYDFNIDLKFLRSKYHSNPITVDFINNRKPIKFENK